MPSVLLALLMTLASFPLDEEPPAVSETRWTKGGFEATAPWRVVGGKSGSFTDDGRWVKLGDQIYQTSDLTPVGEAPGVLSKDGTRSFRAPFRKDKIGYFKVPSGEEISLEIEGIESWSKVLWDREKFLYVYRDQAKPTKSGKKRKPKLAIEKWDLEKQKKVKEYKVSKLSMFDWAIREDGKQLLVLLGEKRLSKVGVLLATKTMKGKKHPGLAGASLGTTVFEGDRVLISNLREGSWYHLKTGQLSEPISPRGATQTFWSRDGSHFGTFSNKYFRLYSASGHPVELTDVEALSDTIGSGEVVGVQRIGKSDRVQLVTSSGALVSVDLASGSQTVDHNGWVASGALDAIYDWRGKTYYRGNAFVCFGAHSKKLEWQFMMQTLAMPVGKWLFVVKNGRVYEPPYPTPIWTLPVPARNAAARDPLGNHLLVANARTVFKYRVRDGETVWTRRLEKPILDVEYCLGGERIVVVHADRFSVRDAARGEVIREVAAPVERGLVWIFDAEGKRGWSAPNPFGNSRKEPMREWNLETGEVSFTFEEGSAQRLQLHPDGRHLLMRSWINKKSCLCVLDTQTHKVVWKLEDFAGGLVTWSADGKKMRFVADTLYEREWSPTEGAESTEQ